MPRAGTTYLSRSLLRNRKALRSAGVHHPAGKDRMLLAALDVRGTHRAHGLRRSEVHGAWDELARKARKHDGTTVISHELLAAASPRQIAAAMSMLKGLDVHVVVTVRDPARQAVAEWQDGTRHGRSLTFEEFRHSVLDGHSETDAARRFRASQDVPAVLDRWGSAVSRENLHVVSCPPASSPKSLLWQRFAEVVGFAATDFEPVRSVGPDTSLGLDTVDLLRRVNLTLDGRIAPPDYRTVVERVFVDRLLANGTTTPPVVPDSMLDDLTVTARRWIKEIDRTGCRVHGELSDLLPVPPVRPARHPDAADPRAQVDTLVSACADLLVELTRGAAPAE